MDADMEYADTGPEDRDTAVDANATEGNAQTRHSLLDALLPATPPKPAHARVVRLFSDEPTRPADTYWHGSRR